MTNPFTTPARTIGGLVTLLAILLLIFLVIKPMFESKHRANKEAEVAKGQQGASIDAGAEAMNTVGNVIEADKATDAAVAQGTSDVRNAPEGMKGTAAIKAACRFKANRNKPECQPKE